MTMYAEKLLFSQIVRLITDSQLGHRMPKLLKLDSDPDGLLTIKLLTLNQSER